MQGWWKQWWMIFLGFLYVYAMNKSVFVFCDFKMAECRKCLKVVGKLFLMIKNGPGFMVSHMHSLFNIVWQIGRHRI